MVAVPICLAAVVLVAQPTPIFGVRSGISTVGVAVGVFQVQPHALAASRALPFMCCLVRHQGAASCQVHLGPGTTERLCRRWQPA